MSSLEVMVFNPHHQYSNSGLEYKRGVLYITL